MDRIPSSSPGPLRALALLATFVASVASVAFLLFEGRRNPSVLLAIGFSFWVLSPYVLTLAGHILSRRWPRAPHDLISAAMLLVALASLAVYVIDFFLPRQKGAFVFVLVPPICWLVIAGVGAIVAMRARSYMRHQDDGLTM